MNQLVTKGIVLYRTNFGEADRILTILTVDHGKIRVIAKGVRKINSKLAGGVELFSISSLTFVKGRGDIDTLISTRLQIHYRHIAEDIDRTMLGYELMKQLNKVTEDDVDAGWFRLLDRTLDALDDKTIALSLIRVWFTAQLLEGNGHSLNLKRDNNGQLLLEEDRYSFDYEHTAFSPSDNGLFGADHIKVLRLIFSSKTPKTLQRIANINDLLSGIEPLLRTMLQTYLRL